MTEEFRKLVKFYKLLDQQQRWAIREAMQTIGRNDIASDLRNYDFYEIETPEMIKLYESFGMKHEARDEMEKLVMTLDEHFI